MSPVADLDLARRAVARSGWRWMPGMRDRSGRRIAWAQAYPGGICDGDFRVRPDNGVICHDSVPDLDDAATRGCLLELVREAWSDPHLYVSWDLTPDGWRWCVMTVAHGGGPLCVADTEAEALLLALEAAHDR